MNSRLLVITSLLAVILGAACGAVLLSDESDAIVSDGTQFGSMSEPLTGLTGNIEDYVAEQNYFVSVGSCVDILFSSSYVYSPGSGDNLRFENLDDGGGRLVGVLDQLRLYHIGVTYVSPVGPVSKPFVIVVVGGDVDFTSPDAIDVLSNTSVSYTATTNIDATFSELGGNAADYLEISDTGVVTGILPAVDSLTVYTYQIKATSTTNPSNTNVQTITFNVYPVAQISVPDRNIDGLQGSVMVPVTLSGNLDMMFEAVGSMPAGLSISSDGMVSGTPTGYGVTSVTIKGTTSEGPVQNPTIVLVFDIAQALDGVSVSSGDLYGGQSVSWGLSANQSVTWSLGDAAPEWLTISGSAIVGSVPTDISQGTLTFDVIATTADGQSMTVTVSVATEPRIDFTSLPTASCVVIPVYNYNDDGTYVEAAPWDSLTSDVSAETDSFRFVFTGSNAERVVWDFGDGTTAEGFSVEHTYADSGTYTVTCTAYNSNGEAFCTVTVTASVDGTDWLFWGIVAFIAILLVVFAARACRRHE